MRPFGYKSDMYILAWRMTVNISWGVGIRKFPKEILYVKEDLQDSGGRGNVKLRFLSALSKVIILRQLSSQREGHSTLFKYLSGGHLSGSAVVQRLSVYLLPRAWSWSPGIESHIELPIWSLLLPLPVSLCVCVSHE